MTRGGVRLSVTHSCNITNRKIIRRDRKRFNLIVAVEPLQLSPRCIIYTLKYLASQPVTCLLETPRSARRPRDVRTVMFIGRTPGGFTTALSTLRLLCVRMACVSPEALSSRNESTKSSYVRFPSFRLCPCSRHALRSRECSFLRIVAEQHDRATRHVVRGQKRLLSSHT